MPAVPAIAGARPGAATRRDRLFAWDNPSGALIRELEPFGPRLEPRAEDCGIERIREAVAHKRGVFVLDIHVELADVIHQETHDRPVIGELSPGEHHLVWALFIELPQPRAPLVWVHIPLLDSDGLIVLFLFSFSTHKGGSWRPSFPEQFTLHFRGFGLCDPGFGDICRKQQRQPGENETAAESG
jgi:hypothetical protein